MMRIETTAEGRERFEANFYRIPGGCHVWLGYFDGDGYGRIKLNGHDEKSHRVAWVLAGNKVTPEKPFVLHHCPGGDDPSCVNPDHLWAGTHLDNARDKALKGRGTKSRAGLPFGVKRQHGGRRLEAQVRIDGKKFYLGTYDTAEEASAVALSKKMQGRADP